ncbi:Ubiquitin carboxyl-terminal hydrolase 10, partial [Microbotryomycetes sp. JL201]
MTDYSSLKVVELKELLKERSLAVSGKKDELIKRLQDNDNSAEANGQDQQSANDPVSDQQHDDEIAPDSAALQQAQQPPQDATQQHTLVPNEPVQQVELHAGSTNHHSATEEGDERAPKRLKVDIEPAQQHTTQHPEHETQQGGVRDAVDEQGDDDVPEYTFEPEPEDVGRPQDMYLDTINRSALDFDFERLCSVTLSHNHIYACLTDGKYFQGRGKSSPAYAHSIAEDHHVYINLETQKVYVLPDGYEVNDPSLDDIKYLLYPTFTPQLLKTIDAAITPHYDLAQKPYYPGFVGLNNIKANSYMNAILHALVHVIPLRNYFILDPLPSSPDATELVKRFGMFCRKVWNPKAFKGQVSPHELLQECSNASGKRFKITEPGDPLEFLSWLLNALHKDLGGNKKPRSSVIYSAFQGEVRVDDQQILTRGAYGTKPIFDVDRDIKSIKSPFLFLALDLPPPPLFQDAVEKNIIPQVSMSAVLAKYDGKTTQESADMLRRFKLTRCPPFLIFHVKRFTKNNFVEQKNPTIVNFTVRGLDMAE